MEYDEGDRYETIVPNRVKKGGETPHPYYQPSGHLEKEDMIILFLSVVLVIATIWLATRVL